MAPNRVPGGIDRQRYGKFRRPPTAALVNDVRNETGQSDPLLVVCSSDELPQAPFRSIRLRGGEPDAGTRRNDDPVYYDAAYREWVEALPGSRRARAGYLPVSVVDSDDVDPVGGDRGAPTTVV